MSFPKILVAVAVLLFGTIALMGWMKKSDDSTTAESIDVPLDGSCSGPICTTANSSGASNHQIAGEVRSSEGLPTANRVQELFNIGKPQLPFVSTVTYSSRVPWHQGRPAWLSDYAAHFKTSRHFIARSLNGAPDYLTQNVTNGDLFTVFRDDINFSFYLLVDASRCRLWFYCVDEDNNEHILLKCYDVCLGRPDPSRGSGLLTPIGKYSLGDNIATYRPGMTGHYLGEKTEMITVFGTRWIPFDRAIGEVTAPAKGFGIHGAPWERDADTGEIVENLLGMGGYASDGCIRLRTEDIEEIFAIVVTRPTVIEIVQDFHDAQLPGREATY